MTHNQSKAVLKIELVIQFFGLTSSLKQLRSRHCRVFCLTTAVDDRRVRESKVGLPVFINMRRGNIDFTMGLSFRRRINNVAVVPVLEKESYSE